MNNQAQDILNKLQDRFNYYPSSNNNYQALCPIGIEIEVKWRDYFPQLWDKYLKNTPYKELTPEQQQALTLECTLLEKELIPLLEATVECGVEKGADKYWEFAFGPATQMHLIINQVKVLQEVNLIPSGDHSLHITIGNLTDNKDSYYMLLLLEMLFSTKERIATGFHKDNVNLSGTWSRKGMGGLFVKDSSDLKYGYTKAIELRTLQLSNNTDIENILNLTSYLSDINYNKMQKIQTEENKLWDTWRDGAIEILVKNNLIDSNWKKPNLSAQYWHNYINQFDNLSQQLTVLYKEVLENDYLQKMTLKQTKSHKMF